MALQVKPKATIKKKALSSARILVADIERLPGYAKVQHRGLTVEGSFWDLNSFKHTTGRRIHPDDVVSWPRTICAAGRFYGDKDTMFSAEWEPGGHEQFMRTMWEWVNESDAITGHNMKRFDLPKLMGGFIEYGWTPPSPVQVIDTLSEARRIAGWESNTLDSLCKRLGVKAKSDKYDPKIAQAAVDGDEKAQKKLRAYNIGDVAASTALYDRLRGYIKHPHLGQFTGDVWSCGNCGETDLSNHRDGEAHTYLQKYRRYQCPRCGAWMRGNTKLQDPVKTRPIR